MFSKQKFKSMIAYLHIGKTLFAVVLVCAYAIALSLFTGNQNTAEAAIPKIINFQGKLTAVSNGNNVANGSYTVEFKLYAASSGGSPLWTETWDGSPAQCPELTVTNGVFNAKLGECEPLTSVDFTTGSLYLTINVEGDGEMSPRKQLVSSAYSFVANGVSGDGRVNVIPGQSSIALTVARSGTDYALQVDTNTASSVTGLKVTSAAAGNGLALATISSGTNENISIDAKGSGTVSINNTATGDVLFAGGSGSTGCTVTNSNGNFTCSAIVQGSTINGTSAIQLNGTDINTAGTLTNVAYENQANVFTLQNQFASGSTGAPGIAFSVNSGTQGFTTYQSGTTANDAVKAMANNLGAGFGVQNLNGSGFSGVEYIDNSGSVAVFTGYNNGSPGEFRFNNIASGGFIAFKIAGTNRLVINNTGTITLSSLAGGGTQCVNVDNSGVLGVTTCSTAYSLWTSDTDADGYDLRDLSNLEFQGTTGAPAGSVVAIFSDNTGDLNINSLTGKSTNIQVNGTDEYNFSSTTLNMNSNTITNAGTINGLQITANTGVITTGTWQGTAVADTYVADTLTIDSSSSVHWNALNNYPAACSAGSAISQLADTTNTCTAFNTDTSITLQDAYDATSGNTITTTTARNVAITLADVATPTSFTIENQDTAATSAQRIFNSIATGTATNGLLIEQTGAGTMTNAIQIAETAGTITDGILITGTLGNILNSSSIDITGAGAITGATGFNGLVITPNTGVVTTGTWNATAIGAQYGGTGINTSASTGVPSISSGTWSVNAQLGVALGGTGAATLTTNGVLYGNGTSAIQATAQGGANTVLVANGGAPSFSAAITVGTSVTSPSLVATTAVTTPSIITSSGALGITPAAGSGVNISLSTTGDFAVNTDDLVVDTSAGKVGIGTASPHTSALLDVVGNVGITGIVDVSDTTRYFDNNVLFSGASASRTWLFNFYDGGNMRMSLTRATGHLAISQAGRYGWGTSAADATVDTALSRNAAGVVEINNGTAGTYRDLQVRAINPSSGNVGIGDTSPASLLTVGSGDLFQVNSSGAIAAATGITSSGTITFSGLGGGGTQCVNVDNSGVLGVTTCSTAYSLWTSDTDADGYDLRDLSNLEFQGTTGAPAGSVVAIFSDNTGDLNINSLTGKTTNIQVNGADEYNFSSTSLDMNSNTIVNAGTINGLQITANTGVITTGTWQGTAIADTYVADTLTIDSSSSVHWNALNNYPAACSAGSAISQLADTTNTCTAFNTDTSITLQDAYDATSGNTITTTTARNVAITLADVATPTSFTIENQDTAATSAQRIFNSIATGTATNGLLIEQTGAGTMTNAIQIAETAGTITDGILITGTLGNILNSSSIDITGAGAITGATGFNGLVITPNTGVVTTGTWNGTAIGAQYGGTGINTSASTGVPSISSGTWSVNAQLGVALGGTGAATLTTNGVLYGNGTSAIQATAQGGANTVLVANGGAPSFSAAITVGTSVTSPTINATTALQFNGADINTAGTLTNVAYENQANAFTMANSFTVQSATALTVARSGADYALQVDTNTASSVTGLKVTSAAAGSGIALATISSGTNEFMTIDGKGSGEVRVGGISTGNILLGGGSGSTGCTVTNSTGAFACTAGGSFTTGTFSPTGANNVSITNSTASGTAGALNMVVTSNSDFVPAAKISMTQTATGSLNASYGLQNNVFSSAVVTGGGVGQTLYGSSTAVDKTGADTATGTYTVYGDYITASNTGRTNVGTVDTYGSRVIVTGDTAGASTTYGLHVAASGADNNYAIITNGGNVGIGDTTPASLLTVGSGDAFQVNSSGAIAAATGITSSGTITLSGLGGGGTQCVRTDNSGVLSAAACGGALTPWTSNVDADGYALQDALNIEFRTAAGSAPAGTVVALFQDNSGDLTANVLTGKTFNIAVNGTDEYNFSSTALAMNSNNITGVGTAITGAAGLTLSSTSANLALATNTSGNITLAPASTGSVQITSGVTTGTGTSSGLSLVANSLTTGVGMNLSSSSLSSGSLVNLAVTGTAAASSTQTVLNVSTSGANSNSGQLTAGARFSNTHTGTTSNNYGALFDASGGDFNFGSQFTTSGAGTANYGIRVYASGATDNYAAAFVTGQVLVGANSNVGFTDQLLLVGDQRIYNGNLRVTTTNTTQTTTSSAIALNANSVTSGTAAYIASSGLTSGKLLDLQSNGTAAAASQTGLNISLQGTNATSGITTYGAQISNAHAGTTSTNVALQLSATNGTTANYALITNGGNVGIGDTTPNSLFTVGSGDLFQINSSGQIGSQQAPVSDYLFALSGNTTNDNSRIIDIVHANDAAEDSDSIKIVNTVNRGTLDADQGIVTAFNSTLTPTATVSGTINQGMLDVYGLSQTVNTSNVTIGSDSSGDVWLNTNGIYSQVVAAPTINDAAGRRVFTPYLQA
ncbi:hypothetical protein IPM19_00035 [bacterium]|nr:MAG: hypothetical protein IPM19_00035 [bacterium]